MELLSGLRVVEWSRTVEAAACGREFARWGADVLALEDADGSPLRRHPPVIERDGEAHSLLWASLGQGKRSERITGAHDLLDDLNAADVFITDAPAGALGAFDAAALDARWPRLVVVQHSPFGGSGPCAGWQADDLVIQALAGFAYTNGDPDKQPLAAPGTIVPRTVGALAALGAVAALLERLHSGRGQWIEVASMEAVSTLIMSLRSEFYGTPLPRGNGPPNWAEVLPTRDGWISLPAWNRAALAAAPVAFGLSDPAPPELVEGEGALAERRPSLDYFAPLLAERASEEIFNGLGVLDVNLGWHRAPEQLLQDRHLAALDYFQTLEHEQLGPLAAAGPPMRASRPALDAEPARDAEIDEAQAFARRERPAAAPGPLDGLRVVDFTHAWLGPYAATLLSDLGAEVIKIEGPQRPDLWRFEPSGPPPAAAPGAHPLNVRANFNMANRGKRNVSIALDSEAGRALALELVARADLVLENFRPRVLQNLRLTHDDLLAVNPRIALVSCSGFGADGPYSNYRANGGSTEANAGWNSLMGYPGSPPRLLGTMQADPIVGAQMALAALAAVHSRETAGGPGIRVEGSMFEAALACLDEYVLLASAGGGTPPRNGNRRPDAAPREFFPCAGEDEWIAISVATDEQWAALIEVAAEEPAQREPALLKPAWREAAGRLADVDRLERALAGWTAGWDARTLQHRLQSAGVPAGVAHTTLSHLADPHLAARGWWLPLEHADTGVRRYQGFAWRFSRTPAACERPAPRLGEYTREILSEVLGCPDDQIDRWIDEGIAAGLAARRSDSR